MPEPQKQIDKVDDIAKEKSLSKEDVKPEDKKIVPELVNEAVEVEKPGTTFLEKKGNRNRYINNAGTVFDIPEQSEKDIIKSIKTKLASNKRGVPEEGKVAEVIMNNTSQNIEKVGAKVKGINGSDITEIDILTREYLIEVKKSYNKATLDQMRRYADKSSKGYCNVGDKKVLLYIESGLEGAGKEKLAEIEKIKDLGVTVITDLNELERLLK